MLSDNIKKNLLDIKHQRYLQYFNTSIIISFTYIIGIIIGFITKQINYLNPSQIATTIIATIIVFAILVVSLIHFHKQLKVIVEEIKTLNL
nr:hypothetical protein [Candidatus Woesearchaeota archaeon]